MFLNKSFTTYKRVCYNKNVKMEEKMNQILQVQEKQNKNKSIDVKKVILFFAICIFIFGAIILGQGIYNSYQAKKNQKVDTGESSPTGNNSDNQIPTISLTQTEENQVVIQIESPVAISYILYSWNDGTSQTIEELGKTNIQEIITIPAGENVLNVSIIDANGNETKKSETYTLEVSKPIIELSVIGNDIKIIVTSETELSYITYKWNSEEEKREDMTTYADKTKYEKILNIPKGQNTLKIVAFDINQNSTEKSQAIKGITKAKTSTLVKGEYITFTVEGEDNIQMVEFEFNGKKSIMNTDTFGETNKVYYRVKIVDGWNYLKITSTTVNNAKDTTVWKYEQKAN